MSVFGGFWPVIIENIKKFLKYVSIPLLISDPKSKTMVKFDIFVIYMYNVCYGSRT
jgi:hypothetical protein